ncbi:MAG: nucleoside hydrolase [Planctomycetaceae bacterium]|nr:nucleoside hydrolase [Planctomycetaceae bacterium]
MTPQKIVIDADPGIGDALAIALALIDPGLEVVGLTAVPGIVSGEQASRNLQTILSVIDPALWPRLGWNEGIDSLLPRSQQTGLLLPPGPAGLGDLQPLEAPLHQPHEAAKLLTELAKQYPGEITLLTLGPLTNVLLAMERYPEFLPQLKGLICLGGSVSAGGDITAAAEFNVYANPEAAQTVLTFPATKTIVPLDVSRQMVLSFDQYDRLGIDQYTRVGQLLTALLPYGLRESRQCFGLEGLVLPEVVALAAVTQARLFERESMLLDVELAGELTRGATIVDRRGIHRWQANLDVLTAVDAQGVMDYVTRLLRLVMPGSGG